MSDKKGLVQEFKEFIAGGNMIELAVGIILGAAIGKVIDAFTSGVMMQFVAAIFGKANFDELSFTIGDKAQLDDLGKVKSYGTPIFYGAVITTLIALVLTGLVLFAIIKAYNNMKAKQPKADAGPSETDLLTEIRDSLRARN